MKVYKKVVFPELKKGTNMRNPPLRCFWCCLIISFSFSFLYRFHIGLWDKAACIQPTRRRQRHRAICFTSRGGGEIRWLSGTFKHSHTHCPTMPWCSQVWWFSLTLLSSFFLVRLNRCISLLILSGNLGLLWMDQYQLICSLICANVKTVFKARRKCLC